MTAAPLELDVLVLGAGPAGASAAMRLAPHCRVAMAARAAPRGRLIGESLPAAARPLLRDLGLWPAFEAQRHQPAWSSVSVWGGRQPVHRDALEDPNGHGWHLDRARFDGLLRDAAVARGARWLCPAELGAVRHEPGHEYPWQCALQVDGARRDVRCRFIVDASGRSARLARHAGTPLERADRLVCLHAWLPQGRGLTALPGATLIEAGAQGWWYSADLADGHSVLAFHTDADLPAARACRTVGDLAGWARKTRLIGLRCRDESAWASCARQALNVAPSQSQWAARAAGQDWLAIGDAALAFDPLASQGLLNSLYTGLQGAACALRHLGGDDGALPGWASHLAGIRHAYTRNLARYYALERRWKDEPFWRRRQASKDAPAPMVAYS